MQKQITLCQKAQDTAGLHEKFSNVIPGKVAQQEVPASLTPAADADIVIRTR